MKSWEDRVDRFLVAEVRNKIVHCALQHAPAKSDVVGQDQLRLETQGVDLPINFLALGSTEIETSFGLNH